MKRDRLAEVQERLDPAWRGDGLCTEDTRWLVAEVERLTRIETAGKAWSIATDRYLGIQNDDSYHTQSEWRVALAAKLDAENELATALAEPATP